MVSVIQAIMENIGLSDEEAKIYEAILVNGVLTPGEISIHTEFPVSKVESLLEKLEKRQIVRKISGIVTRYSITPPFNKIAETLEKFRKEAENVKANIDKKFKETLTELENSIATWKSNVRNIIDKEFAKISKENTTTAKTIEKLSLQTSKSLEKEVEKNIKQFSKDIESQLEIYNNKVQEHETSLTNILDTQLTKTQKEKEIREKELTEGIDTLFKYNVENVERLSENIQKTLSENIETLLENLNQIKDKNINLLEKSLLKFNELSNKVKNELLFILRDYQNGFDTNTKEFL
ncbi:MAG: helix-turn-helix domain-containing protein, partial [Candidatus Jordarchaeaceae archaeon]